MTRSHEIFDTPGPWITLRDGSSYHLWDLRLGEIWRNRVLLRERSVYERAVLSAFVRTLHSECSLGWLRQLFLSCDRHRLRAAGDPLPGTGPFRVYRGVAGRGAARRVRGFSWSASYEYALEFASDRAHQFCLPDPAVFCVTVDEGDVLAYSNAREEREFIVLLSASAHPVRVDPRHPRT